MNGYELLVFWLGWVLAVASPGPATLSVIGCATRNGRMAAVIQALGILTGGGLWGVAAAIGVGSLMMANAWLFEILRYLGALYLLYLAANSLKRVLRPTEIRVSAVVRQSKKQLYFRGLLINLSNPKAILQWGALYAVIVPAHATILYVFSVFGVLFMGGAFVYIGYAVLFSSNRISRIYLKLGRVFDAFFALFFGMAGMKLIFGKLNFENA